jgi:tRNA modification GTPase
MMGTWASVMTGKGTGAIATIQVFGRQASDIVRHCFQPSTPGPFDLVPGRVLLGSLVDGDQPLDEVLVGCEGPDLLAIHCHGNPLIVEAVMVLLERRGATPVTAETLLATILSAAGADTLQTEARLSQAKARTLEGARLVHHQVSAGLRAWLLKGPGTPLADLKAQAGQILADSLPARLLIEGCTAVLVGPTNSGKSTLFNWLSGQDRSLVSDIRGTTRDWVQAECRLGPLCLDLIDTAGLDLQPIQAPDAVVDRAAQGRTLTWTGQADLILLVLDATRPHSQVDAIPPDRLSDTRCVTVLNKADLQAHSDGDALDGIARISALRQTGREALAEAVCRACGVRDLSAGAPVAFTSRQRALLGRLVHSSSPRGAAAIIEELLQGPANGGAAISR